MITTTDNHDIDIIFQDIMEYEPIKNALDFLKEDNYNTTKEQVELCEIAAPTFYEENRAKLYKEKFKNVGLDDVYIDNMGNVLGTIKGAENLPKLLVAAHLDTVFSKDIDVKVKIEDSILYAPGISDDTRGLAEILTVIRAIKKFKLKTVGDIIFCGNVCEEGLGDLKGIKYIFENIKNINGFITIDGCYVGDVLYLGTGSRRYKISYKGQGGHSLEDFGIPNPIHALGRAISKIAAIDIPSEPKTTFSVGVINGGTSINSIAYEATMYIDLRSNSVRELRKLESDMLSCVNVALVEENNRWQTDNKITLEAELIGCRPAAEQSSDELIVKSAVKALDCLGIKPRLSRYGSTDANIPMSMKIPALCIGRGGESGNIHNLNEWFDPKHAYLGPQKTLLTILSLVGIENLTVPLLSY